MARAPRMETATPISPLESRPLNRAFLGGGGGTEDSSGSAVGTDAAVGIAAVPPESGASVSGAAGRLSPETAAETGSVSASVTTFAVNNPATKAAAAASVTSGVLIFMGPAWIACTPGGSGEHLRSARQLP